MLMRKSKLESYFKNFKAICASVFIFSYFFVFQIAKATDPAEFRIFADSIQKFYEDIYPVMATLNGHHDRDSLWSNPSASSMMSCLDEMNKELSIIESYDTTGWPIDDQIDYSIMTSSTRYGKFFIRDYPTWRMSPMIYIWEILSGIFPLETRQYPSFDQRSRSFLGRIRGIPQFLESSKPNIVKPNIYSCYFSVHSIFQARDLIKEYSDILVDSFPDENGEISTLRDRAVFALNDYIEFVQKILPQADSNIVLGKENFEFLISNAYSIEFNSDSLLKLSEMTFQWADSLAKIEKAKMPPEDTTFGRFFHDDVLYRLDDDSLIFRCEKEVDYIKEYLEKENIITVPDSISKCAFIDLPAYLNHAGITRDFYEPPGIFDRNQTGYYYRNLDFAYSGNGEGLPPNDMSAAFREDIITSILPGRHLLTQMAGRIASNFRKIQENDMMIHGWELYIKELLMNRGFFGDDPQIPYFYYKELRGYAIGAIVDIKVHTGKMSTDSVRAFIVDTLGPDSTDYKGQYYMCVEPTHNLSYVLGRFLLIDMRQKAIAKERKSFSLKAFHAKILSEGMIPPILIAKKYGWQ